MALTFQKLGCDSAGASVSPVEGTVGPAPAMEWTLAETLDFISSQNAQGPLSFSIVKEEVEEGLKVSVG